MKVLVSDCVNMTVGIVWYSDADMVRVTAPWRDSYLIHILHLHPHPRHHSFSARNKMCLYIVKRQPSVLHLWVPGAEVGCGLRCGLVCLCCKWHAHCCVMLVAAEVLVESLGSSHLFSSLLPLSLAYVGPVAAQDPRVIMIVFNASRLRVCSPLWDALQLFGLTHVFCVQGAVHDCFECETSEGLLTFMGCLTAVRFNPWVVWVQGAVHDCFECVDMMSYSLCWVQPLCCLCSGCSASALRDCFECESTVCLLTVLTWSWSLCWVQPVCCVCSGCSAGAVPHPGHPASRHSSHQTAGAAAAEQLRQHWVVHVRHQHTHHISTLRCHGEWTSLQASFCRQLQGLLAAKVHGIFCLVPDICGKSAFVSEVFMCNSGFPLIFAQRI